MATRSLITSTAYATLATAALLGFVSASAQAGPIPSLYHLTFGDFVPEQITVPHAPSPADPLAGFTQEAVTQFLAGQDVVTSDISFWGGIANNAGYVLGEVQGFAMPGTPLVFYAGQVLCCSIDFPSRLIAMNDNGIFIGHDESIAFVGDVISPFQVIPEIPNLDAASIANLEARYGDDALWQAFWFEANFTAIDNANRIGGDSWFGNFVLDPAEVSAVPEPSSLMLLLAAVMALYFPIAARRRLR